jgi:hypothetical protein
VKVTTERSIPSEARTHCRSVRAVKTERAFRHFSTRRVRSDCEATPRHCERQCVAAVARQSCDEHKRPRAFVRSASVVVR